MNATLLNVLAGLLGLGIAIAATSWLDHLIAEARRLDLVNDREARRSR